MAKLSAKQQKFVEEYLIDLNATQAAIRAGYSVKTANEQGARLLANVSISNAIAKEMAERSKRTGISADRVLIEIAKLAFVNPANVINMDDGTVRTDATDDDLACVQSVKKKKSYSDTGSSTENEVKLYDKKAALELLGKHLGIFTDKFKIEGAIPVVIMDDMGEEDD